RTSNEQPQGQLHSPSEAVALLESLLKSDDYKEQSLIGVATVSKRLTQAAVLDRYGAPDGLRRDGEYSLLTYGWLTLMFDKNGDLAGVLGQAKKTRPGEVTVSVWIREKVNKPEL